MCYKSELDNDELHNYIYQGIVIPRSINNIVSTFFAKNMTLNKNKMKFCFKTKIAVTANA